MARTELDRLTERLRAAYSAAWDRVLEEQQAIIRDPNKFRRRARLVEMQQRIVSDMDGLDAQARRFLSQQFPEAYVAGGQSIASDLGDQFRWSQTHRSAIARIADDTFADLLFATDGVRDSTKKLVRRLAREQTLSKLIEGKTALQAARELRKDLAKNGIWALTYADGSRHGVAEYSNMVLRTKTAVAYNSGSVNVAKALGVRFMEVFDGTGCGWISHTDLDVANGTVRSVEECASALISHPNCVISSTRVRAIGELLGAYRGEYVGPTTTIRTLQGHCLTVTPNHPVLTQRGFLPASSLSDGDHVLSHSVDVQIVSNANVDDRPPTAEDLFSALFESSASGSAVPSPPDFHGDGEFFVSEVDAVLLKGELWHEARGDESISKDDLVAALTDPGDLSSLRSRSQRLDAVTVAASRLVSGSDGRGIVRSRAQLDSGFLQSLTNDAICDPDLVSQRLAALPFGVTTDAIVEIVNHDSWSGHVFDLSTETGVYLADGIVIHNCQRAFGPRPDIKTKTSARKATIEARKAAGQIEAVSERAAVDRVEARARQQASRRAQHKRVARKVERQAQQKSAEQAANDLIRLSRIDGNVITSDVRQLVESNGGSMEGLGNRFNGQKSLTRKLKEDVKTSRLDKGVTMTTSEAAATINDAVRFTAIGTPTKLIKMQDEVLHALEARGHRVVKLKNTWQRGKAYNGINVQMEGPTGLLYELQFHTAQSFEMKGNLFNHPLYEEARLRSTSAARRTEVTRQMVKNNRALRFPNGAAARFDKPWVSRVYTTTRRR